MKKIKYLLLFGILTLLGIGSSFSQFYDLRDNTGSQLLIPSITHISTAPRSRFTFTLGNSDYYSSGYTNYNHELTNIYACYDSSYNVIGFRDTWGLMTFGDISNCSSSANRSLITPSSGTNGIRIFNYLYMRSNTSISPYSERKDSSILRYLYFDFNKYYTYSGYVQDVPDGYYRRNLFLSVAGNYGVVSQSLTDGSFLFTSLFDDSFSISNPSIYSGFILLHFGGYDSEYYNGGGTLLLSVLNESIIFNYYTGFYLNYSDISQVSPSLNGYITYNNSISEGYSKFFQMITGNNNVILINGSIPSNQLVFTAYGYTYYKQTNLGGGLFTKTTSYDFNFEVDNDVPSFITPSGNQTQSTGSIAINTGLLNSCLNDLTFGELNSYLCNQLLAHLGNPIQIPGTSGQYISVSIDENGNLTYWITTQEDLEQQMSGFVWVENEDGSRSTVCPSGDCLGTVLAQPINHGNTGFEFTTGTVLDMITNLTGWVGRCPFPYTDFRLGKNLKLLETLQNWGFKYDPFIIVNCAVAGFHYGRHSIDRQIFDDTFEHPLLYGDTQKHRSLFVFLDFIVILGLLGLSAFLKKIF